MGWPQAWVDYLLYFLWRRDYFESHEVLEACWKEEERAAWRPLWRAWIQLAVALYHQRRGNYIGARKLIDKAAPIFTQRKEQVQVLGVAVQPFLQELEQRVDEIAGAEAYRPFILPLEKPELLQACQQRALEWGWDPGYMITAREERHDRGLRDKHRLRPRHDVIRARERALVARHRASLYPRKGM